MATLPDEEDNFLRILKLISGVAPKAVRTRFNHYFPPVYLSKRLMKDKTIVDNLYVNRRLAASQMALLYPSSGQTSSDNYDVTLMICLLRNLANIRPPSNGFEKLPSSGEIHDGADLVRIKYFRNKFAHTENDKISTTEFNDIWTNLTGAVVRLGGTSYQSLCDGICRETMNKDILLHFRQELNELKDEIHQTIGKCVCYDSHEEVIEKWKEQDRTFVKTNVVTSILLSLEKKHIITVTGTSGVGKSAIIHHIALHLCTNKGYNIIPCIKGSDIIKHFRSGIKQVFILDDVCGRYTIILNEAEKWEKIQENISSLCRKGQTKILVSCRLHVFKDFKFKRVGIFTDEVYNLTSEENLLSAEERLTIAHKYLSEDVVDNVKSQFDKYDFLPLMCYICKSKPLEEVVELFNNPFIYYSLYLDNIWNCDKIKYCVLFLCILHNGHLPKSYCTEEESKDRQIELKEILKECSLGTNTPIKRLIEETESLRGTFLEGIDDECIIIHDKMFDFLCWYFGINMQNVFLKYADITIIRDRIQLKSLNIEPYEFTILVEEKNEHLYFRRIVDDLSNGKMVDVFYNTQMIFPQYRSKLKKYIQRLDVQYRCEIADAMDPYLILYMAENECYFDFIQLKLELSSDIRGYSKQYILLACQRGETEIIRLLIEKGADINIVDNAGNTPLSLACKHGRVTIVTLLLDAKADINKGNEWEMTPLMIACIEDNASIVSLLLQHGADFSMNDKSGKTPFIYACERGSNELINLLVEKGCNVNEAANCQKTPFMSACESGHITTVSLLLNNGVDINKSNKYGETGLMLSSKEGHVTIVTLLIDKGADIAHVDHSGWTSLMKACRQGHLCIVRLLVEKGSDINKSNNEGVTPLMLACKFGHTSVATFLIAQGADLFKKDNNGCTCVNLAIQQEHKPIIEFLIKIGAVAIKLDTNVEKYVILKTNPKSPLIWTSILGDTDTVKLLLENGCDINRKDNKGRTSLMWACEQDYDVLARTLIEKGANVNQVNENGDTVL